MQNQINYGSSKKELNGAENFINHLNFKNQGLKEKIEVWQEIILKGFDKSNLNQSEKNICSWYQFNNISYKSGDYILDERKEGLIQEFNENPYYIFKNMVEIMGRDLLSKHLRETLSDKLESDEESRLQVFTSSDADDVFGGVDLITKLELNGKTQYMGIDIAVSANKSYLTQKVEGRTQTKCIEFNLNQGINPGKKIPRYVLQFSPKLMSELLDQYLSSIEKGIYVDTLELYKKIHSQNLTEVRKETNFKINNLIRL